MSTNKQSNVTIEIRPNFGIGVYSSDFVSITFGFTTPMRVIGICETDENFVKGLEYAYSKMAKKMYRKISIHKDYVILYCFDTGESKMFLSLKNLIDNAIRYASDNGSTFGDKTTSRVTEIIDKIGKFITDFVENTNL